MGGWGGGGGILREKRLNAQILSKNDHLSLSHT